MCTLIILHYEITWIKQYIKCLIEGKLPAVYIECEGAAESVTGSGVGNSWRCFRIDWKEHLIFFLTKYPDKWVPCWSSELYKAWQYYYYEQLLYHAVNYNIIIRSAAYYTTIPFCWTEQTKDLDLKGFHL